MNRKLIISLGLTACLLFVAGCDTPQSATVPNANNSNSTQPSATAPTATNSATSSAVDQKHSFMKLNLYFPSSDGAHLVLEVRNLPMNENPARTAIEALISGSNQPQTAKVFPAGTKLQQISIKDGTAYVDFNKAILKGNGGSATELLLVTSVVDTLTEFSTIEKVQFSVDGKKIDTLYGHMDLSEPLSRSESIIKK